MEECTLDYFHEMIENKNSIIQELARENERLSIENSNLRACAANLQKQLEALQDELGSKPKIYVREN